MLILFLGIAVGAEKVDWDALTKTLRTMIEDAETTDADLREAISRLGNVTEARSFWTSIVQDPRYSIRHRQRCLQALLNRHRPGTIGELAVMLNKPNWLRDEDIEAVEYVVGLIPVDFSLDDTVLRMQLLPSRPSRGQEQFALYLRLPGKISRTDFSTTIRRDYSVPSAPAIAGLPIIQFGFSSSQ